MPKRKGDVVDVAEATVEKQRFVAGVLYLPDMGLAMVRETDGDRTGLALPNREVGSDSSWQETARRAVREATGFRSKVKFNIGSLARDNALVTVFLMDAPERDENIIPSENLEYVPIKPNEQIPPEVLLHVGDAALIDAQMAFLDVTPTVNFGQAAITVGRRPA